MTGVEKVRITSDAFEHNGPIPRRYTGWGDDISPDLKLSEVSKKARSIAVIMNDMNHPIPGYNHWVIWNLPAASLISANIPHGAEVLDGAIQGVGYGKHRYRGPKPPSFMKKPHQYDFHVFVLDKTLELSESAKKKALLQNMEGHILQHGMISGNWGNTMKKKG